jgi:hypothetical protein
MCVGEDSVEGEVAAYEEASPRYGEVGAPDEDVMRVKEVSAVGACDVIRGGGAVAKGVISLE